MKGIDTYWNILHVAVCIQQGAQAKTLELIERMLELGEYSYEQIAKIANVSVADIKKIEAKKVALV